MRKKQNGQYPWMLGSKDSQPIWFHCASGEFEYAKPVIRLIKQTNPNQKILVTYFSPSIAKAVENSSEVDFACPTPWDTAGHWQAFLNHYKPKALLIARTDLWPMMLRQSNKANIPQLLFSKTMSGHKSGFAKIAIRWLMPHLDDIFCVSEEDRQNLFSIIRPYKNIHASGDTRYDQCFYRLSHPKNLKPLNNFNKKIFVAGSTWPADEDALVPCIADQINDIAFVIAPHEPTEKHIKDLTKKLEQKKINYQLYSVTESWDPNAVLIIDQVGILADLYAWGQFAFVGGSMNRSVHSVMEPLAQGQLCFVGPKHQNNREAMEFKHQKIADIAPIQIIKSSKTLNQQLVSLKDQWKASHKLDLQLAIKQKMGASQKVLTWISNNTRP